MVLHPGELTGYFSPADLVLDDFHQVARSDFGGRADRAQVFSVSADGEQKQGDGDYARPVHCVHVCWHAIPQSAVERARFGSVSAPLPSSSIAGVNENLAADDDS